MSLLPVKISMEVICHPSGFSHFSATCWHVANILTEGSRDGLSERISHPHMMWNYPSIPVDIKGGPV